MRKLLRIKKEGAELVELYLDVIQGFEIEFDNVIDCYTLCGYTPGSRYIIVKGNLDYCHSALNKIHRSIQGNEEIIEVL